MIIRKIKRRKNEKTKDEVKEELIKAVVEGEKYKSEELHGRADNAKLYQDAIPTAQEYDTILLKQKRNVMSIGYRQGCVFKKFKGRNLFLEN